MSDLTAEEKENKEKKVAWSDSWKPARILDVPAQYLNNKYKYRFVTTNKEGNVAKKLNERWEIDKEVSGKLRKARLLPPQTIKDGSQVDETYRIREMVLMHIPKPIAKERAEFYQRQNNMNTHQTKSEYAKAPDKFVREHTEHVSTGSAPV